VSVADEELTPRRPERGTRQRLTWLGHSTVLLELEGVRLLTDPVGRGRVFHLRRVGEALGSTLVSSMRC
jgi:Predicted Zn-dependent hydrolases of the beta-lactamase fold